jgi:hypothetical protein
MDVDLRPGLRQMGTTWGHGAAYPTRLLHPEITSETERPLIRDATSPLATHETTKLRLLIRGVWVRSPGGPPQPHNIVVLLG